MFQLIPKSNIDQTNVNPARWCVDCDGYATGTGEPSVCMDNCDLSCTITCNAYCTGWCVDVCSTGCSSFCDSYVMF